ncbi:MAG: hypothetical protein JHC30_07620 [Caldisericum sp.]|nr:hypothetical protein [Caldisericum sp.]
MSENKIEQKKIDNFKSITLDMAGELPKIYKEIKKLVAKFVEDEILREKVEFITKDFDDLEKEINEMWALYEILLHSFEADATYIKRQFYKFTGNSFILRFDEDAIRLFTPSGFWVSTLFYDELEKKSLEKFIVEAFIYPGLLYQYTEHIKRKIEHIILMLSESYDFIKDIRMLAKWLKANNQI